MHTHRKFSVLPSVFVAAGFAMLAGSASAAIVFDDSFDIGAPPTRNNDAADPLDRQWYKNVSTALAVVDDTGGIGSGNALNLDNTDVGNDSFGKFAANFSTVSLNNIGDTAVLSFDVRRLTSGTPSGSSPSFRFGLYDNDDSPLTSDSGNNILSNTADDIGYFFTLNVGRPGAGAIREGPESQGILGGPAGANEVTLSNVSGNAFAGLNDAEPHDVVTTLLRTGDGMRVLVDVDGTTVIDAADAGIDPDTNMPAGLFVTDFDVVGFGIGSSNVAYDYRVDNIRLITASLSVLPGDFNGDGKVDAADYVVWRKNDGTQAGYDTWRANFGATVGSGSGSADDSLTTNGAPEPASAALLLAGLLALVARRRVARPGG